jgi:hypothetical protein
MTTIICSLHALSDAALLAEVKRLTACERTATARLVAALAELDERRLYLGEGFSSLFTYCTQALHLSEHAAYTRIGVARAVREFPAILQLLADGDIHLTALRLLAPHLTADNYQDALASARHRSKREVEEIVARLRPQPDAPAVVRKLPVARPAVLPVSEAGVIAASAERNDPIAVPPPPVAPKPPIVAPLAPERYKVQLTVSKDTYDKLRRVQDLLRHSVPNGDLAAIFDRALSVLLEDLERTKCAAAKRPRAARSPVTSRHVPAAVKRAVWERDGGRCAFVGAAGRCAETGFLEFHHVVPFAAGGETSVENLELRCRAHNAYEAEQYFGTLFVRERAVLYSVNSFRNELSAG